VTSSIRVFCALLAVTEACYGPVAETMPVQQTYRTRIGLTLNHPSTRRNSRTLHWRFRGAQENRYSFVAVFVTRLTTRGQFP